MNKPRIVSTVKVGDIFLDSKNMTLICYGKDNHKTLLIDEHYHDQNYIWITINRLEDLASGFIPHPCMETK